MVSCSNDDPEYVKYCSKLQRNPTQAAMHEELKLLQEDRARV